MAEETNRDESRTETPAKERAWWLAPLAAVGVTAVVTAALWGAFYALFRGSAASIANLVAGSSAMKVLVIGVAAAVVVGVFWGMHPETGNAWAEAPAGTGVAATILAVTVVVAIVAGIQGGYSRGVTLAASAKVVDGDLATYRWRTPWDVASEAVDQRADVGQGDFATADTTYLPVLDAYSTPVTGRGFQRGFTKVVIQTEGSTRTQVCDFDGDAPRPGGAFGSNLRRAVAFVDATLLVNHADVWAYCDGESARLVVPVTRYAGGFQKSAVPAGVVVFDGPRATYRPNVGPGELPGPVYPMSLAAAQRESLVNTDGFVEKVFSRAGYELSQGEYDTGRSTGEDGTSTAALNNSELLLARADGNGADFVTPLTPRSNAQRITAISTIAADRVTAGELNELVVHQLGEASQRGNVDQVQAIRANFPGLGWETGIAVAEIVPTDDGTWEASLRNGGVVAKRVRITGEQMVLLTASGEEIDRTSTTNQDAPDAAAGDDAGQVSGNGGNLAPSPEMVDRSNEELLDLIDQATAELRRRAAAGN